MSSKDDGKGAEPDPQNGKRCSLSSESSDGSSSSSEGETPPPNKRPRKTRGEFPQVMYDPRVDTLTSQISDTSSLKRRYVFGKEIDSPGNPVRESGMNVDRSPESPAELSDREQAVLMDPIDHERCRYPYCIVWTPIPVLTWMFPFLGHMGICTSSGVIRDFAGPYFVSEDLMAFGNPTKYWQLSPAKAHNGQPGWDAAVHKASEIYKKRMHIIFYDNCHSHVAMALNLMGYGGSKNWNMVKLAFYMIPYSKYVSVGAFVKTWLPFVIIVTFICLLAAFI